MPYFDIYLNLDLCIQESASIGKKYICNVGNMPINTMPNII